MQAAAPFDADRLIESHPSSRKADASWPRATRAALRAAYFASLRPDEGRYPEFCIALDDSRLFSTEARLFAAPVPLTPNSLGKYAQVVDRRAHAVVVSQQDDAAAVVVDGVDSVHARMIERARVPEVQGARAWVVVHGPGVVALHDNDLNVSLYDRGAYRTPETWRDVLIPTEVSARLVDLARHDSRMMPWTLKPESMWAVEGVRWQLARDRWIGLATPVAVDAARTWLAQLASAIARDRHGGAILILPTSTTPDGILSDPGTEFERPVTSPASAPASIRGLLEYIFTLANFDAARAGLPVLRDQPEGEAELLAWAIRSGVPAVHAAFRRLRDWAKATAALAAVDGAIVLDEYMSPRLFGAKFASTEVAPGVEHDTDAISRRGTRYRSMAAAVGATPGSIGVVVSQDGPISVLSNPTGRQLRNQNVWM